MADNQGSSVIIEKRYVKDLKGLSFMVETYQRGYRWKELNVKNLLNDINDSLEGESGYCLQPLIVYQNSKGEWELVDGQQRLTTLLLILTCLGEKQHYSIAYKTRRNGEDLDKCLEKDVKRWVSLKTDENDEIDDYFIKEACKTIAEWFGEKEDTTEKEEKEIKAKKDKFRKDLLEKVFFIWYEIKTGPEETFIKENANKIQLSSAELIRALILSENYTSNSNDSLTPYDRQVIAVEWENIEHKLNDDSFWFFLCNRDDTPTRIDLIFNCIANYYNKPDEEDPFFSFNVFDRLIKDNEITQREIWEQAVECFAIFENFYEDFENYHKVGYLIATRDNNNNRKETMFEIYKKVKDRQFDIDKEIKNVILDKKTTKDQRTLLNGIDFEREDIEGDEVRGVGLRGYKYGSDSGAIYNILLLFNILTLLQTGKSGDSPYENHYRFPFDKFKRRRGLDRERWDIEHIHAVNSQLPDDVDDLIIVIKTLKEEFSKSKDQVDILKAFENIHSNSEETADEWKDYKKQRNILEKDCARCAPETKKKFINAPFTIKNEDELFESLRREELPESKYSGIEKQWKKIKERINKIHKGYQECLNKDVIDSLVHNGIDNLTLLDYTTNRQYKDDPFVLKRKKIIERERQGQFIPLCTKNVFLKLYSDAPSNVTIWDEQDRESYLKEIARVLTNFLCKDNSK